MPEFLLDMLTQLIDICYEVKVLQVTMRVTRLFGSFQVVWFNTALERVPELHKKYQRLCEKQFGDTDYRNWSKPFPPTEVTVYTQPLEFGRSVMLELDFFISMNDSESVKRGLAFGYDAINIRCWTTAGSSTGPTAGRAVSISAPCRRRAWAPTRRCWPS